MLKKTITTAVLVAAAVTAAYWYWSPFLAIREIQQAAQARDANAFNARVDYPRLRESLKVQLSEKVAEKVGDASGSGNPLAALGNMLGVALANQMVETMVRPEVVMQAMRVGEFGPFSKPQTPVPGQPPGPSETGTPSGHQKPQWTYERPGVNQLIAYAVDPDSPGAPNGEHTGVVFERSGFADWKLSGFRLPTSK